MKKRVFVVIAISLSISIAGLLLGRLVVTRTANQDDKYNISQNTKSHDLIPKVEIPLSQAIQEKGFSSFPKKLYFLAFKKEKKLEVWGINGNKLCYIKSYDILAASGVLGPKLKEGDRQVPEGIYKIIAMNPKSVYHFAMLIDYPNQFDKQKARLEGRSNLGGDICIHGKAVSAGCLAMGDVAIEELYNAVTTVGMNNVTVIISPYDFRGQKVINCSVAKLSWCSELYEKINLALLDMNMFRPS